MGEEKQLERNMNAEMHRRRPVGRPRARWKDLLLKDLEASGLSLEDAAIEAMQRDR